ncbi:MAG TPA: hypothetical protein VFF04_02445 [Candidatus Babeliales bacterium]|nr:hypothetical protein [Candidatus Babeliales bacterium]
MKKLIIMVISQLTFCSILAAAAAKIPNLIESVSVNKNMLRIKANPEFHQQYLTDHFFAEYDKDIDLNKLDFSLVTIPFIMNVAPIVWISDKQYSVESMDQDLYNALNVIQKVFQAFYQSKSWSGKIVPKKLVVNKVQKKPNTVATLFSHGLDAVYTSLANRDKKQVLITVCGGDIGLTKKKMWEKVQEQCKKFASIHGHTNAFVRSNFNTFRNFVYLRDLSPELNRNWFGWTSQSLSYTSLAAPIAYLKGCSHVLLASTRTSDNPYPYGTHPVIDNNIAYAGMYVDHDGPEANRIDKIREIAHICTTHALPKPMLRVCWGKHPLGGNCNECEKCFRTIVELLVEGQMPQDYGFDISLEAAIKNARAKAPGKALDSGLMWHWKCIQKGAQDSLTKQLVAFENPDLKNFVHWIADLDLKQFKKKGFKVRTAEEKEKHALLWKKAANRTFTTNDLTILFNKQVH